MLKNIELKDAFSKMTEEQLNDFRFLSQFIFSSVGLFLSRRTIGKTIKNYDKLTCFGGLRCLQYPDELAKLLVFLKQNKVNSFCEMGVAFGGNFFVIDSFLRAVNPNMSYSLAIDLLMDNKMRKDFSVYQKKFPNTELIGMDAREFIPDRFYDFCFIDYAHSAENCRISYNTMKKHSRFIGFHDIYYKKYPDLIDFWVNELKGNKTELLNEDPTFPCPLGIGIIKIE